MLIVAAIATAAAGIALASQWRRALQVLGFSVAGFAVTTILLLAGARVAVERLASDQQLDRRAAGAVWDAFLGDLTGLLLLVAAFATVVAAAVATQATLPNLGPALAHGWELVSRSPRRTVWRVARGAGLVVVGAVIVFQPLVALRLLAVGVGLFVLYAGVAELLTAARDRRAAARRDRPARPGGVVRPGRGRRRRVRRGRPVPGHGRHDRAGRGPQRGLQRPRRAVREAAGRGDPAGVAQLDVVVGRAGLVLGRPHADDPRPAAGRARAGC